MLRRLQIVASAEQLMLERCRGHETDVAVLFGRNLRIARETSVRNDHAMGQSIAVSARPKGVQEVDDVLIADSPGLTELAPDSIPSLELADLVLGVAERSDEGSGGKEWCTTCRSWEAEEKQ